MFIMPTIPIFEIMEYVYIIIIFALFPLGLLYYVLPKKMEETKNVNAFEE